MKVRDAGGHLRSRTLGESTFTASWRGSDTALQNMASKSVVDYTARRVTYETSLPLTEVIARLDNEINKQGGGPEVFRIMRTSTTKAELEEGFNALTKGRDFV